MIILTWLALPNQSMVIYKAIYQLATKSEFFVKKYRWGEIMSLKLLKIHTAIVLMAW